eukprot:COSAG02_NODE_2496_length_8683_cov_41.529473_3_plen_1883_part_00
MVFSCVCKQGWSGELCDANLYAGTEIVVTPSVVRVASLTTSAAEAELIVSNPGTSSLFISTIEMLDDGSAARVPWATLYQDVPGTPPDFTVPVLPGGQRTLGIQFQGGSTRGESGSPYYATLQIQSNAPGNMSLVQVPVQYNVSAPNLAIVAIPQQLSATLNPEATHTHNILVWNVMPEVLAWEVARCNCHCRGQLDECPSSRDRVCTIENLPWIEMSSASWEGLGPCAATLQVSEKQELSIKYVAVEEVWTENTYVETVQLFVPAKDAQWDVTARMEVVTDAAYFSAATSFYEVSFYAGEDGDQLLMPGGSFTITLQPVDRWGNYIFEPAAPSEELARIQVHLQTAWRDNAVVRTFDMAYDFVSQQVKAEAIAPYNGTFLLRVMTVAGQREIKPLAALECCDWRNGSSCCEWHPSPAAPESSFSSSMSAVYVHSRPCEPPRTFPNKYGNDCLFGWCDAGFEVRNDDTVGHCDACKPGTYSNDGNGHGVTCLECPSLTYCSEMACAECTQCEPGRAPKSSSGAISGDPCVDLDECDASLPGNGINGNCDVTTDCDDSLAGMRRTCSPCPPGYVGESDLDIGDGCKLPELPAGTDLSQMATMQVTSSLVLVNVSLNDSVAREAFVSAAVGELAAAMGINVSEIVVNGISEGSQRRLQDEASTLLTMTLDFTIASADPAVSLVRLQHQLDDSNSLLRRSGVMTPAPNQHLPRDYTCPGFMIREEEAAVCTTCPRGKVKLNENMCEQCLPGKEPNGNSSVCVTCTGNTFSLLGTCEECLDGKVANNDRTNCDDCPQRMLGKGGACVCEYGHTSINRNWENLSSSRTPDFTMCHPCTSLDTQRCGDTEIPGPCIDGVSRGEPVSWDSAKVCPGGPISKAVICPLSGIWIEPGDSPPDTLMLIPCEGSYQCEPSTTNCSSGPQATAQCGPYHTGFLCASCEESYTKVAGQCVFCDKVDWVTLATTVLSSIGSGLFLLFKSTKVVCPPDQAELVFNTKARNENDEGEKYVDRKELKSLLTQMGDPLASWDYRLNKTIKQMVGKDGMEKEEDGTAKVQITLAQFQMWCNVSQPSASMGTSIFFVQTFGLISQQSGGALQVLDLLNFDVQASLGKCLAPDMPLIYTFLVVVLSPVGASFTIILVYLIVLKYAPKLRLKRHHLKRAFVNVSLFAFAPLTRRCFTLLMCRHVAFTDKWYLIEDMSITCFEGHHWDVTIVAMITAIAFVIGLPGFLAVRVKSNIKREQEGIAEYIRPHYRVINPTQVHADEALMSSTTNILQSGQVVGALEVKERDDGQTCVRIEKQWDEDWTDWEDGEGDDGSGGKGKVSKKKKKKRLSPKDKVSGWCMLSRDGSTQLVAIEKQIVNRERSGKASEENLLVFGEIPALNPSCYDALYRVTTKEAASWFAFTMLLKLFVNMIFICGQIIPTFEWGLWLQILLILAALVSHRVAPYVSPADNFMEQVAFLLLACALSVVNSASANDPDMEAASCVSNHDAASPEDILACESVTLLDDSSACLAVLSTGVYGTNSTMNATELLRVDFGAHNSSAKYNSTQACTYIPAKVAVSALSWKDLILMALIIGTGACASASTIITQKLAKRKEKQAYQKKKKNEKKKGSSDDEGGLVGGLIMCCGCIMPEALVAALADRSRAGDESESDLDTDTDSENGPTDSEAPEDGSSGYQLVSGPSAPLPPALLSNRTRAPSTPKSIAASAALSVLQNTRGNPSNDDEEVRDRAPVVPEWEPEPTEEGVPTVTPRVAGTPPRGRPPRSSSAEQRRRLLELRAAVPREEAGVAVVQASGNSDEGGATVVPRAGTPPRLSSAEQRRRLLELRAAVPRDGATVEEGVAVVHAVDNSDQDGANSVAPPLPPLDAPDLLARRRKLLEMRAAT